MSRVAVRKLRCLRSVARRDMGRDRVSIGHHEGIAVDKILSPAAPPPRWPIYLTGCSTLVALLGTGAFRALDSAASPLMANTLWVLVGVTSLILCIGMASGINLLLARQRVAVDQANALRQRIEALTADLQRSHDEQAAMSIAQAKVLGRLDRRLEKIRQEVREQDRSADIQAAALGALADKLASKMEAHALVIDQMIPNAQVYPHRA